MPSEVAAAEAASQPKPRSCSNPDCKHVFAVSAEAAALCPFCKWPQPVGATEDYFSVFRLRRSFGIDLKNLEKKYYRFSRYFHPDRFAVGEAAALRLSMERMGFVNQAYSTLKDPVKLRAYLLKLEGITAPTRNGQSATIPLDLAEEWFEIEPLLAKKSNSNPKDSIQNPENPRVRAFTQRLSEKIQFQHEKLRQLEIKYDKEANKQILEEMAAEIQRLNYLNSLQAQTEERQ